MHEWVTITQEWRAIWKCESGVTLALRHLERSQCRAAKEYLVLTACLLLWCLGQPIAPAERVSFTNDFRHSDRSERIVGYERSFFVFGAVEQTTAENAVFAGALPVTIQFGNRFSFAGGAIVASTTVPHRGTHANFMARLQLDVTRRFSVSYWHWSNAHLGNHNPSVDSIGVTMRLRQQ